VSSQAEQPRIFISYSHRDKDWLEKLQVHLKPYEQRHHISAWDDTDIEDGAKWRCAIASASKVATVGVLLVSPDFLASKFIMEEEVPGLIKATEGGRLRLLWVAVRPSAVDQTEISQYQALNDPKNPLSNLSDADQESEMVEICRKISEAAQERPPTLPSAAGEEPTTALAPIRIIQVGMTPATRVIPDNLGRLWVWDDTQLRVFDLSDGECLDWLQLPSPAERLPDGAPVNGERQRYWKAHLGSIWHGRLVLSDWDGSLYQFKQAATADDWSLYRAQHDDLPISQLTVAPDGQLIGAAWNGLIRAWDEHGQISSDRPAIRHPHLPLHLMPLRGQALVVVDQANEVWAYDRTGEALWKWQADDRVWWCTARERGDRTALFLQVGRRRLASVVVGQKRPEVVDFEQRVVTAAARRGEAAAERILVAQEGGKVEWLTTAPFRRLSSVEVGHELADIVGVLDWEHPACLNAVGVTAEGELLSVRDQMVAVHSEVGRVDAMLVSDDGRFVFACSGDEIAVYRNPAIKPPQCQVTWESTEGTLKVGEYRTVKVQLRNTGRVPVHHLEAEMHGEGRIETCAHPNQDITPIRRDEEFELEFPVRAQAAGDGLPVSIRLRLGDEGGLLGSPIELPLRIASEPADH